VFLPGDLGKFKSISSMGSARTGHTATPLADNTTVLIAGGNDNSTPTFRRQRPPSSIAPPYQPNA
jgi:hypothetical protein